MVQDRLLARLSIAFVVVALLLASIGLYGVLSYGVARRTSEIGIRKALGARHGTLMTMVLRETAWLLLIGLAAGSALAFIATRLITSRLFGLASPIRSHSQRPWGCSVGSNGIRVAPCLQGFAR